MPGTTSTALPSFSHDQHHKTDAAKQKGIAQVFLTPPPKKGFPWNLVPTLEIKNANEGAIWPNRSLTITSTYVTDWWTDRRTTDDSKYRAYVRVTCDVGYLCANFCLPIGLSVLELRPMYTTDVRQKHRLMHSPYGGGGIIVRMYLLTAVPRWLEL